MSDATTDGSIPNLMPTLYSAELFVWLDYAICIKCFRGFSFTHFEKNTLKPGTW